MTNRLVLITIIFSVWLILRLCNLFDSGVKIFFLLGFFLLLMVTHTFWLLQAQYKDQKLQQTKIASHQNLKTNLDDSLDVDILISVKNESNVIESTVRKFLNLTYKNYKLWIIDDCSTDNTLEILKKIQLENPKLNIIARPKDSYPGKSAALNTALAMCKAKIIAVFDADASVCEDFFEKVLPFLTPDKVGALQVQKKIYPHQQKILERCQASEYALDTYFQMGRDLIGGVVELRGNGEVIKRSALIDVGGWNDKSITDDLDLSMRLLINKWDIVFCCEPFVYEQAVTTLDGLIKQRTRWAEGSIRRYLDYIFPLNSITRLSLIERIDLLAFTVFFIVPGLIGIESCVELYRFFAGGKTHPIMLSVMAICVLVIAQFNLIVASRFYQKELNFFQSFINSFFVNAYIFGHWLPCMLKAIFKIMVGDKSSKWHPTKHVGLEARN